MVSVKRNFAYNVAYQLLAIIIPLVTMPYLSRVLGTEGLGEYSYTLGIAECFSLFILLGVNNYGNRAIARSRTDSGKTSKTFWEIYSFQLVMGILLITLYVCYIRFLSSADSRINLIWILYLISVAMDVNWFFFGMELFKLTVIRNTVVKLLTFAAIFIFVKEPGDVWVYCLIFSSGALLSQLVMWPFLLKEVGWHLPRIREIIVHIKPNLVLFVPVIAVSVYQVVDRIILGSIAGYDQTGLFDNSIKVTTVPFAVITALGTVMLPRVTNLIAKGDIEGSKTYLLDSFWLISIISSAIMFGIAAISLELAPVYFGEAFAFCSVLILVLIFDVPFRAWGNVIRTQYLIPLGKDNTFVMSVVVGAIVNVILNFSLVPFLGALGSAIATLVTEISVCLYQVLAVKSELPILTYIKIGLPYYGIGIIMLIAIRLAASFLNVDVVGLFIEIIVGAVVFCICFVAHTVITKNQRAYRLIFNPVLKKIRRSN